MTLSVLHRVEVGRGKKEARIRKLVLVQIRPAACGSSWTTRDTHPGAPQRRGHRAVHGSPGQALKIHGEESQALRGLRAETVSKDGSGSRHRLPAPRAPGSPQAGRTFAVGFPSCLPGTPPSPLRLRGQSLARLQPKLSSLCLRSGVSAQGPPLSMRSPAPSSSSLAPPSAPLARQPFAPSFH